MGCRIVIQLFLGAVLAVLAFVVVATVMYILSVCMSRSYYDCFSCECLYQQLLSSSLR